MRGREGGREGGGGGGRRGADTELKTKTPHVNVGNDYNRPLRTSIFIVFFSFSRLVTSDCSVNLSRT